MREFLKGLEFDDETVDTIMAEHGKLMTKNVEKIGELTEQLTTAKLQAAEAVETVKSEYYEKLGVTDDEGFTALLENLDNVKETIAEKPELDTLRAELKKLNTAHDKQVTESAKQAKELEKYRIVELVRDKGVTGSDAKLAVYEIRELIASGKTSKEAADEYFEKNPPPDPTKPPTPEFVPKGAGQTVIPEKNPWAKDTRNLAEQTRIFRENPQLAVQLAKAAGVILNVKE